MHSKILIVSLLLVFNNVMVCQAQKLPAKQEGGAIAPASVKIDGKVTEWGNLKAYNPATEIFYTIANDDEKLYFVCSAKVEEVIQKIINGGITLSISSTDKKTVTSSVAVTYPIVPFLKQQINYDLRPPAPLDESAVSIINEKINGHLKEIKISGVNEFGDGSIPVYNDKGVIGGQYVSRDKIYTCELSFPLSLIRSLINDKETFNYKVQVNGMGESVIVVGGTKIGDTSPSEQAVTHGALYNMVPTYFNATYTLAKK